MWLALLLRSGHRKIQNLAQIYILRLQTDGDLYALLIQCSHCLEEVLDHWREASGNRKGKEKHQNKSPAMQWPL